MSRRICTVGLLLALISQLVSPIVQARVICDDDCPAPLQAGMAPGGLPAGTTPSSSSALPTGKPSPAPPPGQERVQVYRVYYRDRQRLATLAAHLDIWEAQPDEGHIIVPLSAEQASRLSAEGYRVELAQAETHRWLEGSRDLACYRDVPELHAHLLNLAAAYPQLLEVIDYGDSCQKVNGTGGYDLLAVRVTNHEAGGLKPRFVLIANIHARELVTPETAVHFVEYLLERYGQDPDATWLLDYHEIYVVPTANPDGRQYAQSGCLQRKNRNTAGGGALCNPCSAFYHQGVDLNRNNPYHWGGAGTWVCEPTYQGIGPASEPETQYLNDWIRTLLPDQRPSDDVTPAPDSATGLLVSLHSYGDLVLWPWGWPEGENITAPNHAQMRTLGRKFAHWTGYEPKQANQLYPTTGDTTDWTYGELGVPAYTFELGDDFFQDCADLPEIMAENLGALLYAAKVARRPYRTPSGPDARDLSAQPATVSAGNVLKLIGVIDDTQYYDPADQEPVQPIQAAVYLLDIPPWITATNPITYAMAAADGVFDAPQEWVAAEVDTAGLDSGRHTLYVRGQDAAGNWGPVSALFFSIASSEPLSWLYLPILIRNGPAN